MLRSGCSSHSSDIGRGSGLLGSFGCRRRHHRIVFFPLFRGTERCRPSRRRQAGLGWVGPPLVGRSKGTTGGGWSTFRAKPLGMRRWPLFWQRETFVMEPTSTGSVAPDHRCLRVTDKLTPEHTAGHAVDRFRRFRPFHARLTARRHRDAPRLLTIRELLPLDLQRLRRT